MAGVIKKDACGERVIPENSYLLMGSSYARTPGVSFFSNGLFLLATRASIIFRKKFPTLESGGFRDGMRCWCGVLFDSGRTEPWEFRLMC